MVDIRILPWALYQAISLRRYVQLRAHSRDQNLSSCAIYSSFFIAAKVVGKSLWLGMFHRETEWNQTHLDKVKVSGNYRVFSSCDHNSVY